MLTSDVRKLFQRETNVLGQLDKHTYSAHALGVFNRLKFSGKEVEVVDDLQCRRAGLLALAAWQDQTKRRVFGLDGGSSRTMVFRNGSIACANQALLAGESRTMVGPVPLEAFRTLAWATHNRDHRTISGAKVEHHNLVTLWRLQLSNDEFRPGINAQRIQEVVKALADAASEPLHALRMAKLLNLDQSDLLFADGRLYPTRLYRYVISEMGRGTDVDIFLLLKEDWKQLIQASLDLVHSALENGFLLVSINKNPESNALLRFGLSNKNPVLWHNDRQWLSALFETIPQDELGYTNWFVQHRHPALHGGGPEAMDLFEEISDELSVNYATPTYHIAFFYVYDPRIRAALRVEVPHGLLLRDGAERLRLIVLSYIARGTGGVPSVIRMADGQARITQEEREALQRQSGLMPDWDYNHSRGAPR